MEPDRPEDTLEFLDKTFYDNTVLQWLTAGGIILGSFVVGKILYWTCKSVGRRLTAKTKTRVDDIVLDMIEEPIVAIVIVAGIWYGISRLNLTEEALGWLGGGISFVIVLCVTWLVARLIDAIFREVLAPLAAKTETDLDDQLLPIARTGVKLVIWSIGVIVALNNAGYNVGALIAGLGIGGLALAMAAQNTVSNVFGGFTVFTDRPFAINDRIALGGIDGFVREIGVRSTRIETLDGPVVSIPNSKFTDSAVSNISATPKWRVELVLGLVYSTTPEKMRRAVELLHEIAKETPNVAGDILAGFDTYGASSMDLRLIYHVKGSGHPLPTKHAVNMRILERFAADGLEFAYPTQLTLMQQLPAKPS